MDAAARGEGRGARGRRNGAGPGVLIGGGEAWRWGKAAKDSGRRTDVKAAAVAAVLGTPSRARWRGGRRIGPAGPWPGWLGRPGPVGPEVFFLKNTVFNKIK